MRNLRLGLNINTPRELVCAQIHVHKYILQTHLRMSI